jgi:hypothetical protein
MTVFKVYFLFKLLPRAVARDSLSSDNTRRLHEIKGMYTGEFKFQLKVALAERPWVMIGVLVGSTVLVLGGAIFLMERLNGLSNPKTGLLMQFDETDGLKNAMWLVINSMVTVGYGDIIAQTSLGRFASFIACAIGITLMHGGPILSEKAIRLSPGQIGALRFYQKYAKKERLRKIGIVFIQRFYRYHLKKLKANKIVNSEKKA